MATKKTNQRQLRKLVDLWATRMGLTSWRIDVNFKTLPKNTLAHTIWADGYQTGEICIDDDKVSQLDNRSQEAIVIHELFHLCLAHLDDTLSDYCGQGSVYKAADKQCEILCDATAQMLQRAYRRKRG